MATVKDLERVFNAEPRLTPGTVRMVTRLLQDGGILPKVRQGKGRGPLPQIDGRHCAAWLVGLAVTRRSGLRNVADATERVKRVMGLVDRADDFPTFGETLAGQIVYYINGEWDENVVPLRILIVNDETAPWAEITFSIKELKGKPDEFTEVIFVTPEQRAKTKKEIIAEARQEHTEFSDAFVIGAEVLFNFRDVFDREEEETAA